MLFLVHHHVDSASPGIVGTIITALRWHVNYCPSATIPFVFTNERDYEMFNFVIVTLKKKALKQPPDFIFVSPTYTLEYSFLILYLVIGRL